MRPNSPLGLGRTQGCGFWADINGASAGSEAEIRQKTWRQLEDLEGGRGRLGGTNLREGKTHLTCGKYFLLGFTF